MRLVCGAEQILQVVKKVFREKAESRTSHVQSSSAVLNVPPSSHSVAREALGEKKKEEESAKETHRERSRKEKTHRRDFSPVLA